MSTIFENEEDLKAELEIAERFAATKDAELSKLSWKELDFIVHKDGIGLCFIEVKNYNIPHDKYEFQVISLNKIKKMTVFDGFMPAYLVVKYSDDVIMYSHVKNLKGEIKHGGRDEREGSANDKEWLLYINKESLTVLVEDIV